MWYKLKRILIYPDGVTEKQVYPAQWKPNANTIAYYPLTAESTVNDKSWNNKTMTNNRSVRFWTYVGVNCWYFSWGSSWWYLSRSWSLVTGNNPRTFSIWGYKTSATSSDATFWGMWGTGWKTSFITYLENGSQFRVWWWDNTLTLTTTFPSNKWGLLIVTFNGTTQTAYLNGISIWSNNVTYNLANTITTIWMSTNTWSTRPRTWYLSECIFENKARTAQEVSEYYNRTKWAYWL